MIGLERITTDGRDVNQIWNQGACIIRNVARDLLGITSGKVQDQKEAWWWNDDVQVRVKLKQDRFKDLLSYEEEDETDMRRSLYKEARRDAKKAVVEANDKAYETMYRRLDTKERENGIYKLAKTRERRQDLGFIRFIKDESERVLVRDANIRCRWYNYFRKLFNEARTCNTGQDDVGQFQLDFNIHHFISREEVKGALKKMSKGKAIGPDQIPVEVWLSLGEDGEQGLVKLFKNILLNGKMLEEWKLSIVVPIYKNKGDAQSCRNYRRIKLLSHTMKLWERVIETRIRREAEVTENQFGFMPGRSTMEAIHLLRSLI